MRFIANDNKKGDGSPDFVKTGQCDLGVAWREEAKENIQTLLARIADDPSFAGPVNAALFDRDGKADLVWSRPKRDAD